MPDTPIYVVTGAAKPGYGQAITRRILKEGGAVIGTFESELARSATTLTDELGARLSLYEVDHSRRDALSEFVNQIDRPIAGLVHGQFYFDMENPERFDHDVWERSLAVNLTAPNYLTHSLKPKLQEDSSVVIVTSTEGFVGSFGASAYAATKAAIHNLVMSFANTLGPRGIRANAVAAGWIGGVMDTDEVFNMSRRITPLGRLGRPEEVASVVWFLLSSEASFVNGATIVADGGYSGVDTIAKYEYEVAQGGEPK